MHETRSMDGVSDVALFRLIGCLHDRANIEQLTRRSMVISMLIRREVGCNWKAYITRDLLWAKSLSLGLHLSQGRGSNRPDWASSMFARCLLDRVNTL